MREQTPFLTKGKSAIRPMRMAEIADRLGLHASTISRAIAGKHVQTDRGVFRLRDFFDGGRIDAAPTAGQGRMAIAQQIADLVAAENKSAPLSDDDVVAALAQRGVHPGPHLFPSKDIAEAYAIKFLAQQTPDFRWRIDYHEAFPEGETPE